MGETKSSVRYRFANEPVRDEDEGALDLLVDTMVSDWDIHIYDPTGKEVGSSTALNGNVEIVAFDPAMTGNYTITITKIGGATAQEIVYLAWW